MALDEGLRRRLQGTLQSQRRRLRQTLHRMWDAGFSDAETGGIGELSLYDQHPGDIGSELAARQVDIGLRQNIDRMLADVERALERIEKGTYGSCERCGRPIGGQRLQALPHATLCVECQEDEDEPTAARPKTEGAASKPSRPPEEAVLSPPFGRTFLDDEDNVVYDGEDAWQDVARYGTSNTPSDVADAVTYDETYVDADENVGIVESVEAIIDDGGRGVAEPDVYPEQDHEAALGDNRPGAAGLDGEAIGTTRDISEEFSEELVAELSGRELSDERIKQLIEQFDDDVAEDEGH